MDRTLGRPESWVDGCAPRCGWLNPSADGQTDTATQPIDRTYATPLFLGAREKCYLVSVITLTNSIVTKPVVL